MIPPGADTVVVRHGEIGTKSGQVQHRMERTLAGNLESMLRVRDIEGSVQLEHGRVFVQTPAEQVAAATDVATDTFGVISASPAISTDAALEAIVDALATVAREVHEDGSFAVRARRAGATDAHPFTSEDLERDGGTAIWEAIEPDVTPEVDLDDPDVTYYVECRADTAYVFLEKRAGPGGFPYGTQGRVVALVSGGIDSPVAAWEMMRRGCEIVALYFDFEQYGGPDHVARASETLRHLAAYAPAGTLELVRIPIGEVSERLMRATDATRMLSLRRCMFAAGEQIADRIGAHALVTGESLGQKSSQTGHNLGITGTHVRYPIHRPLLGLDKQEIIARAKRIGTYEEATINAGCNRVAPDHPATGATLMDVTTAEPDGLFRAVDEAVDAAEWVDITASAIERTPIEAKGQR